MIDLKEYCAFLRTAKINGKALRMDDVCDVFGKALLEAALSSEIDEF